jgi:type I restriction enzyme S subunit
MTVKHVKLGDVAEFIRGITFTPQDVLDDFANDSVAVMRTKNVQETIDLEDVWKINESFVKNEKQYLSEGDLLVSSANSWNLVGKASWIPKLEYKSTFGGFVTVLRGDENKINKRYLYYWFVSRKIQAMLRSFSNKTTNISNLNLKRSLELSIPLPPLAEQKRIAEVLDTADRILKQRESAIAKLDQLAQSVFVDMFQKHIKKLKLKDTCSFISGGTPSKDEPKFWNGDVAWISSADIEGDSVKEVRHFVTESAINNSATNPILPNNILVVTRTGVGKVVVTDRKFCFSQDITGLVLKKEFMPEFIAASLRNKQDEIVKQARGATIKGVTRDVIANVEIPAASFLEQQKFSERILQIDSLKKNYEIDRIKINVLLKSLQHQSFAVN